MDSPPIRLRSPRLGLGTLLLAVAVLAVVLALARPFALRALGPNTWIVRTETRPDGTTVRVRIRRYPDRDVVYEEVLRAGPGPGPAAR